MQINSTSGADDAPDAGFVADLREDHGGVVADSSDWVAAAVEGLRRGEAGLMATWLKSV